MARFQSRVLLIASLLACLAGFAFSEQRKHHYEDGEAVTLWVNKVGPYNNPQETYNYYYLPFCKAHPERKTQHRWGGLGEVLEGNELINSQIDISFKVNTPHTHICSQKLTEKHVAVFRAAIRRHYWFEFFVDDLPAWGFIGENISPDDGISDQFIYTHHSFDISYNGNRIIQVNLTAEEPRPIVQGTTLEFTYAVNWTPTTTPFARRFERYLDFNFFERQIHWFSIFNSFMMVLFLTGIVAMILMRTLRKDYARYANEAESDIEALERDISEESGWKLVHGDVFRPPRRTMLLAALVGTGSQLAVLNVLVILFTIAGTLFEERGMIVTTFIICYACTSLFGGYVSGTIYVRHDGRSWGRTALLTACLLPGTCFLIASCLNTIAVAYHSLEAVPFGSIVTVVLIWAVISGPLCIFGAILARNYSFRPTNPCRVKRIPSPIPLKAWYLRPPAIIMIGGLLPFGSIFIELYFIFTSFWNYKVYFVYGFFLLVFLILLIVTSCVAIVGTYFLLNAENYHWQWTSFMSAASTAFYVFLYSVHYFVFKTHMSGFFQTAFYFGYTAMFCLALGIMCGAVGYTSAAMFVRRIYRSIKCD